MSQDALRQEKVDKMYDLRNAGYTLEQIGKIYGVSRQRIQQYLGDTRFLAKVSLINRKHWAEQEVENNPDVPIEDIMRDYKIKRSPAVAAYCGKLRKLNGPYQWFYDDCRVAIETLESLGVHVKFDGLKQKKGFAIETEYGQRIRISSRRGVAGKYYHRYRFTVRKSDNHAFVLTHLFIDDGNVDAWMVIPMEDVSGETQFCYPTSRGRSNKWVDNWGLIVDAENKLREADDVMGR